MNRLAQPTFRPVPFEAGSFKLHVGPGNRHTVVVAVHGLGGTGYGTREPPASGLVRGGGCRPEAGTVDGPGPRALTGGFVRADRLPHRLQSCRDAPPLLRPLRSMPLPGCAVVFRNRPHWPCSMHGVVRGTSLRSLGTNGR